MLEEECNISEEEDKILKQEDQILESYLMGMKIEEGQLTLPPVSEQPDGFDLFYQRLSRRRVYEYEMDDGNLLCLFPNTKRKPWMPRPNHG